MYKTLLCLLVFISILSAGTYSGGSGTQSDPYQIATSSDLIELSNTPGDWGAYFIQIADITFNPDETQVDWDGDGSATWDAQDQLGFSPIGNAGIQFTGNYDGQNFSIYNLYINRPSTNRVGLFGYATVESSEIKNVHLVSVNITGNYYVGALVGLVEDKQITGCSSSGTVIGQMEGIGGLIGRCIGSTGIPYVINCYSSCDVTGYRFVGGLIGSLVTFSHVHRSYSTGSVSGEQYVGGLTGYNAYAVIDNSYARGNVTRINGSTQVEFGGFSGYNNNTSIQYSYSTGIVYESPGVVWSDGTKGFIGTNIGGGTITSNFYDTEASLQGGTAIGATGITTSEMKTHTTFINAGWDFVVETDNGTADIWDMDYSGVINEGYPYLNWQDGGDISLPVQLTFFKAFSGDGEVTLKWITESELNNDAFILERSVNGESFIRIAEIKGQGTKSDKTEYTFTDKYVINGQTYYYRLADRDFSGRITYHAIISVTPVESGLDKISDGLIEEFNLFPAYPNPFNPETTIKFNIPNTDYSMKKVKVSVYDMLGHRVATLFDGALSGGSYEVKWKGENDSGIKVASGLYLIQLESKDYIHVQKVLLIK